MEKYIPYEKLSKKKQKEWNAKKRSTWGGFDPTTRKPENSKAYNRQKAKQWKRDPDASPSVFLSTFFLYLPPTKPGIEIFSDARLFVYNGVSYLPSFL